MPEFPAYFGTAATKLKRVIRQYLVPDNLVIRRQYRSRTGIKLNLVDPKDLSEKVQWLKLHDRSALHTMCADKIKVRDYVADVLGKDILVPAVRVTYDPADISPDVIREKRFVIKTNHDQGGVFICQDRATFDWQGVRADVTRRLALTKYHEFREYQYKGIRPGILIENFVEAEHGGNASDLKIYCFHGQPRFIQVVVDRFENRREAFYDPSWTRMGFKAPVKQLDEGLARPPCLDRLLRAASQLSEPFLFCRIDFLYGNGDRAWFGEVTFHHGAGLIRFDPPEFERAFGDMIDLSRLAETRRRQDKVTRRLISLDGGVGIQRRLRYG